MKALTYLVLVFGLLWSGFWFYGARAERKQIEAWIHTTTSTDRPITTTNVKVRGFPNRFDTTLSDVERTGALHWRFPFLQLLRLSYRSDHMIVAFPDVWEIEGQTLRLVANTQNGRASVRQNDGFFKDIVFEAERMSLSGANLLNLDISEMLFALRPIPVSGSTWDVAISAMVPGTGPDTPKGRLTLRGQVTFDQPITKDILSDPSPLIESISLTEFAFEQGAIQILFSGESHVDQAGVVEGVFTGTFSSRDAVTRFVDFALPTQDVSAILVNDAALTLMFSVEQGHIRLGDILLGRLPKLN